MQTTRFTRLLASTIVAGSLVVGVGSALPASARMAPVDGGVIQVDPCLLHPEICPGLSNPGDPNAPGDTPTTLPTPPTTQPEPTTTAPRNPDVVKAKPAFTG